MVKYSEITESVDIEQIKAALTQYFSISGDTSIDDQGFVSIDGTCYLVTKCDVLPVKFKHISENFICYEEKLISLTGCPTSVGRNFTCSSNKLTSLAGCPTTVGGDFACSGNLLRSLLDCPTSVGRNFSCWRNKLVSLSGCPSKISGTFDCSHNKLKSLAFGPEEVYGDFYCNGNNLTSLDGLPKIIGGAVYITLSVNLPVLRLVGHNVTRTERNSVIVGIINKYTGNPSRANIVACQNELIAAGFEGNAKW